MTGSLIEYIYHKDVDAICFQSSGNFTLSGKAVIEHTHARELVCEYPEILFNLGFKLKETSTNIPYIVGAIGYDGKLLKHLELSNIKEKKFECLIINCPVKNKIKEKINFQLLRQSIAVIEDYIQSFNLNKVVVSAPKIESTENIIFI